MLGRGSSAAATTTTSACSTCPRRRPSYVHARMRCRTQFSGRNIIVLSIIAEEHYLSSFGPDLGISPELHRLELP